MYGYISILAERLGLKNSEKRGVYADTFLSHNLSTLENPDL
jgi:hypothetical protein